MDRSKNVAKIEVVLVREFLAKYLKVVHIF